MNQLIAFYESLLDPEQLAFSPSLQTKAEARLVALRSMPAVTPALQQDAQFILLGLRRRRNLFAAACVTAVLLFWALVYMEVHESTYAGWLLLVVIVLMCFAGVWAWDSQRALSGRLRSSRQIAERLLSPAEGHLETSAHGDPLIEYVLSEALQNDVRTGWVMVWSCWVLGLTVVIAG